MYTGKRAKSKINKKPNKQVNQVNKNIQMKIGTAELINVLTDEAITKVHWSQREFTIVTEAKTCGNKLRVLAGPHKDFESGKTKVYTVEFTDSPEEFIPEFFNSKKSTEWGYMRIHVSVEDVKETGSVTEVHSSNGEEKPDAANVAENSDEKGEGKEASNEETKPEETKPEDVKPEETSEDTKTNTKPEETSEDTKTSTKPEDTKPDE